MILETIIKFLRDGIEGDAEAPPPPEKLGEIAQLKERLSSIQIGWGNNGIEDWLNAFRTVIGDEELRETLLIRALQMRAPQLTEALILGGLITARFEGAPPRAFSFRINWNRLDGFLKDSGHTVIQALLEKIQDLNDLKVAQVLTVMLLFSPKELLKLEYAKQGFAALPDPADTGAVDLIKLVNDLINSPVKLALPTHPPFTLTALKDKAVEGRGLGPNESALTVLGPDVPGADRLDAWGVGLTLKDVATASQESFDLGGGWKLTYATNAVGQQTYKFFFKNRKLETDAAPTGDFEIRATKRGAAGGLTVIGPEKGTRLEIGPVNLALRLQKPSDGTQFFGLRVRVDRLALAITTEALKLLGGTLNFPDEIRFETDISLSYLQGVGLQGQGGQDGLPPLGAEFAIPIHHTIGTSSMGLTIDKARVRMEAKIDAVNRDVRMRAAIRLDAQGKFGPLQLVIEGPGAWFGRWENGGVGGVLLPDGMGLSLSAGPISGGGFLKKIADNEFGGPLQIKILGIGAFAFGLYKKLASGDISVVVLIGIRLPPPGIQVGFGFAISGFGGLVGINRRADTDRLRERLTSGAAGDVLFCDNPVANAPRLLGDMQQLFPDEKAIFLIGPTFKLNWSNLLFLDLGVFIELPGPRQIFLAGSARMVIGLSEQLALIYLRLDFAGGIDLTKQLIWFDGALVRSHVLGVFDITGGVGLRIAYGNNGYFVFTIGGFNTSFNPGAMEVPRLARVGASMRLDASVAGIWMKLEMYLALTPNTFQLGSNVEAGLKIGPLGAHGWFKFDALIQFKPFRFEARIDSGFDIEVFGESFYGVRVEGMMTGPGPIVVQARASVKLLLVRVSGNVTFRLGPDSPDRVTPIGNIIEHLKGELSRPENLRADGDDRSVVLKPRLPGPTTPGPSQPILIAPVGELIWEQKRAPLNIAIQKLEGVDLTGWRTLSIECQGLGVVKPEKEQFSVGTYLKVSDAEALNSPRFCEQTSGVRIGADQMSEGKSVDAEIKISLVMLPKRFKFALEFVSSYMTVSLAGLLNERSGNVPLNAGEARVKVNQESWARHSAAGKETGLNAVQALANVKVSGGFAAPASEKAINLTDVI